MAQVLIRNVSDATLETYRAKARLKGISLEQELRNLLEAHRPYTPEERVALSKCYRKELGPAQPSLTLDEIRDGLE